MVSSDDASKTIEFDDKFIICPEKELALNIDYIKYNNLKGKKVNDQFVYSSELNKDWLTVEKLKKNDKMKRLILGTANFCDSYGIMNKKMCRGEIIKI